MGFWGYDNKPERSNESWLEDIDLNEMITFTTRQKTRQAKSKNPQTPVFVNCRRPQMVPENFKTNASWIDNRYKLHMPQPKKTKCRFLSCTILRRTAKNRPTSPLSIQSSCSECVRNCMNGRSRWNRA